MVGVGSRGKKASMWAKFAFGCQYHEEILIALRGLTFDENVEVVKLMLRVA